VQALRIKPCTSSLPSRPDAGGWLSQARFVSCSMKFGTAYSFTAFSHRARDMRRVRWRHFSDFSINIRWFTAGRPSGVRSPIRFGGRATWFRVVVGGCGLILRLSKRLIWQVYSVGPVLGVGIGFACAFCSGPIQEGS